MTLIGPTLQRFFTDRLAKQKAVSRHTVTAYRDGWHLFLVYLEQQLRIAPAVLDFNDVTADVITGFLTHLETSRCNSVQTRNHRLAALRAFFAYAALWHPEHAATIQRILAIPPKRHDTTTVSYLDESELTALVNAPDTTTWEGRRDQLFITLAAHTGLRVTELLSLTPASLTLTAIPQVTCQGKGRKDRILPLTRPLATALAGWISSNRTARDQPIFATRTGRRLTRDAIALRLRQHTQTALICCPSLAGKHVTPHVLRHTCAMRMLTNGVDLATISLWLGHADASSTNPYLHADMELKRRALARADPPKPEPIPPAQLPDPVLAMLEAL